MAIEFTLETGEGIQNANSYVSTDEFRDISDAFGYVYSGFTETQIEIKLMRSAIILDADFRHRYPGTIVSGTQGLEWPRQNATYYDGTSILYTVVPKEVKYACVELVYLSFAGTNLQPVLPSNGPLREERVKVDVIEEQKKYNASSSTSKDYLSIVEDHMSRITGGKAVFGRIPLVRVGGGF